ncbi:MAG: formylglycine-generating enzyme family protein [Deltaproteobacteria bacterium]|nr:formylglycine-generating enzyme family protein [Deltaproteobacteria bacterium]
MIIKKKGWLAVFLTTFFIVSWLTGVQAQEVIPGYVLVPAGSFPMGNESGSSDEQPVHTVTISSSFYLSITEVTQKEWYDVMGTRPWVDAWGEKPVKVGNNYPATYVSWDDVQDFIAAKNAEAGMELYRLPTEAEWEYACRAGTTTLFSFGGADLGDYAWYRDNAYPDEFWAHEVGEKLPNPWGLYDMHGNVWEWCQDWYSDIYYTDDPQTDPQGPADGEGKVVRGGSFMQLALDGENCTSANRLLKNPAEYRWADTGFRLLREVRVSSDDRDGDGIPNDEDDYPDDATKATPDAAAGSGKLVVTLTEPAGAFLAGVAALADTDASLNQADKPEGYDFPYGLVTFTITGLDPGEDAVVEITFPSALPEDAAYYKVDDAGFYEYEHAVIDGATVTLNLTDGGAGDSDETANGRITDPGGPAVPGDSGGDDGGKKSGGGGGGGGCFIGSTCE